MLCFSPRCSRCSSACVCPAGTRVSPLGSFCDGGERSVRGGVTGGTVHPTPRPPRCSGPIGRPLHDRGCELHSYASALLFFFFSFLYVDHPTSMLRGEVVAPRPKAWALSLGPKRRLGTSWLEDCPEDQPSVAPAIVCKKNPQTNKTTCGIVTE